MYGDNLFVAVKPSATYVLTSSDAITWNSVSLNSETPRAWVGVCYGNGRYVAISTSRYAAISDDGVNWREVDIGINRVWKKITFGKGFFCAVAKNYVITSVDGVNWNETSLTGSWTNVCFHDNQFVGVATDTATTDTVFTLTNSSTSTTLIAAFKYILDRLSSLSA